MELFRLLHAPRCNFSADNRRLAERLLLEWSNSGKFAADVGSVGGGHRFEWCVPVLAEVLDLYPNSRRLCEELQRCSPAIVVATLHQIPRNVIEDDAKEASPYGLA